MKMQYFIYLGGVFHLLWALFDSFWPRLFNWKETLSSLDDFQRVLLPILSQLIIFVYLGFAYISFFHTAEMLTTSLGRTLLIFISLYWLVRSVMQIYYMGFNKINTFDVSLSSLVNIQSKVLSNKVISYLLMAVFMMGIVFHAIPVLTTMR